MADGGNMGQSLAPCKRAGTLFALTSLKPFPDPEVKLQVNQSGPI
jgi:hypothetical protein